MLALASAACAAPEVGGLGYLGFEIEFSGLAARQIVVVARGIATISGDGDRKNLIDAGQQLESWLAQSAAAHVEPAMMKHVTEQIAKPQ